MSELVVIASCYSVAEAHILRGMLESVGIPAMLRNEYIVGVQWMYTTAVGGVEVVVPAPFSEDAVRVLRGEAPLCTDTDTVPEKGVIASDSIPANGFSEPAPRNAASPPLPQDPPVCPSCGGQGRSRWLQGLFVALPLLFGMLVPKARERWRCKNCGKTF